MTADTAALDDLDGLVAADVGRTLHRLAWNVAADQAIVEIGSYRGKSTAYLAAGARDGVPVYAVDPWEQLDVTVWCRHCEQATRAEFEAQLASVGLLDRVIVWQDLSVDVATVYDGPPVGLLFVDGDHAAASVWADLVAWQPHLAASATIAVDDYAVTRNPGVAKSVDTFVRANRLTLTTAADGRLAVCR